MTEEELIRTIFAPLAQGFPGALGLKDDCALLTPAEGHDLVLTTDAIAEGVHFFADDAADDIAWKALAVNISDLAAKGAKPVCYLLSVAFPDAPPREWLVSFAKGLRAAHDRFGIQLAGGDTDRRPGPMAFTITAIGDVPRGEMVPRAGAKAGDLLYVTGVLGSGAVGLCLRRRDAFGASLALDEAARSRLLHRYLRPEPRLEMSAALRLHARAAMDISDGLIKDLGRLAEAAGLAGRIDGPRVPLDPALGALASDRPRLLELALTGGDDYEILAAVAPEKADAFESAASACGVAVARIGTLTAGTGVTVLDAKGEPVIFSRTGWDHFA